MPLCDGSKVVRSAIHGYGIVATRRFLRGELVMLGEGVLYGEDDDFDDTYALVFDGDIMRPPINASVFYDLACQSRWLNHSCAPNTHVDTRWDDQLAHPVAWWTATRDVEIGEEFTYDYAFTASVAEPCGCGASTCRGLIVDPDEIDQVSLAMRHLLKPKT
jgi:uncharacterized protein